MDFGIGKLSKSPPAPQGWWTLRDLARNSSKVLDCTGSSRSSTRCVEQSARDCQGQGAQWFAGRFRLNFRLKHQVQMLARRNVISIQIIIVCWYCPHFIYMYVDLWIRG